MTAWGEVSRDARYANFNGFDPYVGWWMTDECGAQQFFGREGFACLAQERKFPLLVRLCKDKTVQNLIDGAPAGAIKVPDRYARPAPTLRDTRYCTAIVNASFLAELEKPNSGLRQIVERVTCGNPLPLDELPPLDVSGTPDAGVAPGGGGQRVRDDNTVVTGIIDDGLPIVNRRFRWNRLSDDKDVTRVEYFWAQDRKDGSPDGFPYGKEWKADAINELLEAVQFDELAFYRKSGLLDFATRKRRMLARRATHGAHVMDLAAGDDPKEIGRTTGQGKNGCARPIVCVQLATAATEDTSGSVLDTYVLDAICYIVDRADKLAADRGVEPLPVVINFSYGRVAGRHDGTSDLEMAIDELIASFDGRVQIVLPAGNSYLARCHARLGKSDFEDQTSGQRKAMSWRVLPDDRTASFMEIWLPRRAQGGPPPMTLAVETPAGLRSGALGVRDESDASGSEVALTDDSGNVMAKASYVYCDAETGRGMFLIALQPTTDPLDGARVALAPSGDWQVTLTDVDLRDGEEVHAWIQRDDTPFGYRTKGRQSYFADPAYNCFDKKGDINLVDDGDSYVKRAGTLNSIATGKNAIVIGGYCGDDLNPSLISSAGPGLADGKGKVRSGPDCVGLTDNSRVKAGVLASGTRSGTRVAMNGTSVAAPQITRALVNRAATSQTAVKWLRNKITAEEADLPDPILKPQGPSDRRMGYGRLRDGTEGRRRNARGKLARAPKPT